MRRRSIRVIVAVMALGYSQVYAAPTVVRSVDILGNTAYTTREILSWFSVHPGSVYSHSALLHDLDAVAENYKHQGYLSARALVSDSTRSADSTSISLIVLITEGRPTRVGTLEVYGAEQMGDHPTAGFEVHSGIPLDPDLLEEDLATLLVKYDHMGRPFARCSVDSMQVRPGIEEDTLDIAIRVDEGPIVKIDEIRVQGNKETSPGVVLRETRIAPGEVYDPDRVDAIRRRLTKLNIFQSVEDPELYLRGEKGGLLLRVLEGSSNTFDGILGYVPAGESGTPGYLTGLASVTMRNLFGTGRKFQFRWQKEDRNSQELNLRYLEPWVFGQPINVGGGFFQRQQDTSYIHRILDARVEVMPADDITAGLSVRTETVIPSIDSAYTSPIPASSVIAFGGDLQYDTRSDPVGPTSGARYHVDYSYGRKRSSASAVTGLGAGRFSLQKVILDVESYLPTFPRQVVALGLHGYDVRGGSISESDMFRFGGATTLRGYRENEFLAAQVAWLNSEYRFILGRRSFFFLFVDAGYYTRPTDDVLLLPGVQSFKYGYGTGVRVNTAIGNIGVSFALGQGDTFSTAKIHISVINEF